MRVSHLPVRLARNALQPELCISFNALSIQSRSLSSTSINYATPSLHPTTMQDKSSSNQNKERTFDPSATVQPAPYTELSPAARAAKASERARAKLEASRERYASSLKMGGMADNSFFASEKARATALEDSVQASDVTSGLPRPTGRISERNIANMSLALNPRPNARARWQRKMMIRHIRKRGRLPRAVQIARTERSHLVKSHFFKTSMKKLAPLARQIAGKSIDEAILQMRFSKKKAAKEVRAHLIQAKNEAIVYKGMGLGSVSPEEESPVASDPGITQPLPHQTPTKTTKSTFEKSETDIYVAEAWVNRGPYGMEPEFRARGRVNILRPPWTGVSVLLKEEKTRTRQKADKEAKAIKKRLGKNMWTQLPDRPITRQSQYVLW